MLRTTGVTIYEWSPWAAYDGWRVLGPAASFWRRVSWIPRATAKAMAIGMAMRRPFMTVKMPEAS